MDSLNLNGTNHSALDHQDLLLRDLMTNLDDFFLLIMGAIILFMQAGFALIELGTVRSKNGTSILIKNISDMCFGFLSFWTCGFAFAFGDGSPVIGTNKFLAIGMDKHELSFMFFQGTFAATCATIVSGAIAERSDYNGYVVFSVLISGIVYPIQTHWCWGPEGWLASESFYDFAGSGVVHLAGGTCALVACLVMGPRIGRYKGRRPNQIHPHNIPMVATGFFVLVFGFLAFNGGSQASISSPGAGQTISMAFVATLVSCCGGGVVALLTFRFRTGYWKIGPTINGALAGMVSVCCGCDGFYPWSAFTAGCVGAAVYLLVAKLMVRIGVDDPIDAIAVHAGGGMWGLLAGPLLREDGVLVSRGSSESMEMFLWNAVGLAAIVTWNGALSFLIFYSLNKAGMLRVSRECEIVGLDIYKHDEEAYPEFVDRVHQAGISGKALIRSAVKVAPNPPPPTNGSLPIVDTNGNSSNNNIYGNENLELFRKINIVDEIGQKHQINPDIF